MELILQSYASSVTAEDGKFHPAISNKGALGPIYFWPNVKYATENEAYQHAQAALNEVQSAMNAISSPWNVVKL